MHACMHMALHAWIHVPKIDGPGMMYMWYAFAQMIWFRIWSITRQLASYIATCRSCCKIILTFALAS